jgi:hypothetical protein
VTAEREGDSELVKNSDAVASGPMGPSAKEWGCTTGGGCTEVLPHRLGDPRRRQAGFIGSRSRRPIHSHALSGESADLLEIDAVVPRAVFRVEEVDDGAQFAGDTDLHGPEGRDDAFDQRGVRRRPAATDAGVSDAGGGHLGRAEGIAAVDHPLDPSGEEGGAALAVRLVRLTDERERRAGERGIEILRVDGIEAGSQQILIVGSNEGIVEDDVASPGPQACAQRQRRRVAGIVGVGADT